MRASGSRAWTQRIVINGKRSEIGLGSADLISLAEARTMALGYRRQARTGEDPLASRRHEREIPAFEVAARRVYERHRPTWKNTKHAEQFITSLETCAFPKLGKRRVPEITAAAILSVLTPIRIDKDETARRARYHPGVGCSAGLAQR
ncbi:DUF4102 domain-containing protein [Falsigemmobacter faecalis]|uniref:DUF4102 domain-containing protein n=1 Tax=Falsigemmobacter faecalis TaxID=2488730 RepID=UPI001F1BD815|nr:DUF4102 domain-containing protein [Falsigemmobacter faecalis]